MLRVMLMLGVLVLVPAVIVFWRTRDRSVVDSPSSAGGNAVSSTAVGTSTLSHEGPSPAGPAATLRGEVNAPESNFDLKR